MTVVMPVLNEGDHIEEALKSLADQDFPLEQVEVLVVDGGSSDATLDIVSHFGCLIPNLFVLRNPKRKIAPALNLGLQNAQGKFLLRMDAHSVYVRDYIRRCVALLECGVANVVGGLQTGQGRGYWGRAIALAIGHCFGVGRPAYKISKTPQYVDTVYLGAYVTDTLRELGGWNEAWDVNEDYELNWRIRQTGGRVYLDPAIRSQYWVRATLSAFARQQYSYGFWRAKTLRAHPDSGGFRYLVSPALVVALLLAVIGIPLSLLPLILVGGGYLVASVFVSLCLAIRVRRPWDWPALVCTFMTLHLSWGSGFLIGVCRWGMPYDALKHTWFRSGAWSGMSRVRVVLGRVLGVLARNEGTPRSG